MENLYQDLRMDGMAQMNRDISYAADRIPFHSHAFYEILFVKSGDIQYFLDDKRFQLQRGDIVMIPPGLSHRPLFPEKMTVPYERLALWIHPDLVASLVQTNPDLGYAFEQCRKTEKYLLRTPSATWSALGATFQMIDSERQQKKLGWDVAVLVSAVSLLVHICRTMYYLENVEPITEKDNLFDSVFRFVVSHSSQRFTLQDVADAFLVSPSTISHMFQKKLGISFYHCVTQRRLIDAKNRILSGDSIQAVWEPCGFADYSTFYRAFRKEYGMSPREFVKKHREKELI